MNIQKQAAVPAPLTTKETPQLPETFIGSDGAGVTKVKVPAQLAINSTLDEILVFARQHNASDVHLTAECPIFFRQYQSLVGQTKEVVSQMRLKEMLQEAISKDLLDQFVQQGDLEFVYTIPGGGRYRITLMKQRQGLDLTARVIPLAIRSFAESGMPEPCRKLTQGNQGMVLVTGPAGCGKTSTLATLVEMINQTRFEHIISIEDPVEVVFHSRRCQITQRQVNTHTLSQQNALRAALREDPDIILISELRDLETIQLAITAAETGHLVFATMNTINAAQTISTLIDSFPPDQQDIVRNMISESLRGIISMQLIPHQNGQGLMPVYEVLFVNTAIGNLIREGKNEQVSNVMELGRNEGMVLFDVSLKAIMDQGIITSQQAAAIAQNPKNFQSP